MKFYPDPFRFAGVIREKLILSNHILTRICTTAYNNHNNLIYNAQCRRNPESEAWIQVLRPSNTSRNHVDKNTAIRPGIPRTSVIYYTIYVHAMRERTHPFVFRQLAVILSVMESRDMCPVPRLSRDMAF